MQRLNNTYNKFYYLLDHLKRIVRINKTLKIESSGVDYIKLSNGKIFTGHKAKKHYKRLHFLLNKQLRKLVSPDLMQVLFDIDFRYMSRKNNLKEGKYLNVKKGDIVFEVGAYIGYHAMRLSEFVGDTGKVIAIEAVPANFDIMKKNIELNNIKNITLLDMAIWNSKGVISMNTDEHQKNSAVGGVVSSKNKIKLPCNTIDNICKDLNISKVDFVRIQINGAELQALQGMEKTIKQKPKLLVAVPYMNKDKVIGLLESKGYSTLYTGHSIYAKIKIKTKI